MKTRLRHPPSGDNFLRLPNVSLSLAILLPEARLQDSVFTSFKSTQRLLRGLKICVPDVPWVLWCTSGTWQTLSFNHDSQTSWKDRCTKDAVAWQLTLKRSLLTATRYKEPKEYIFMDVWHSELVLRLMLVQARALAFIPQRLELHQGV